MSNSLIIATVSIFAIMDAVGAIPLYIEMLKSLPEKMKLIQINKTIIVAAIFLFGFLFFGLNLLNYFSVSFESFRIAGGIIVLIVGIKMVLGLRIVESHLSKYKMAIVPLATPLLVGPGVITTVMLLAAQYGYAVTVLASFINLLFTWLLMFFSLSIYKFIGRQGSDVISKIMGLFITAIAVEMILGAFGL